VKILQVIASLDPRGGGPMEGVRQIAQAAARWGNETTVVCLDDPGSPFLESSPFPVVALGPSTHGYGYTPRLRPWLTTHAKEFDAVIVNGLWQFSGFAVWLALHGTKVPYFVYPHGMLDPYFKRQFPLKHLKKWLYWPWAEYRVLRDARAVLFTCEEERLLARESFGLYRCNEVVSGFGTAPPPFEREPASHAFLSAFPGLRGKRLLVFLGRVHPKKGCDLLLRAFAEIASADPQWQLVLAGPGEEALISELKRLARQFGIEDKVTWCGMLAGTRKWGALYCAEVFVLPSHQENFGIAVAEALACGTPVLISNRINIWREVVSAGAGLVAADSLEGTRQLLLTWMDLSAGSRALMRAKARQCFESHFDIRAVARELSQTVRDLIDDQSCRSVAASGRLSVG
jgi:glycosyltransferase involved in cell wall biosynthesis